MAANPNVYDFLGANSEYFQKASWQVYTDASGSEQYVGKVNGEIEIDMGKEDIEWYDNESGVQVLYILTSTKMDPRVNFEFAQIFDPNTLPIVYNLEKDDSDPNYTYNYIGSDPYDYGRYGWCFVSKGLGGLQAELYVRSGICTANGTWTSGAAGALAAIPASVRMLQDTTITNGKRDLGYFRVQKLALS